MGRLNKLVVVRLSGVMLNIFSDCVGNWYFDIICDDDFRGYLFLFFFVGFYREYYRSAVVEYSIYIKVGYYEEGEVVEDGDLGISEDVIFVWDVY